MQEGAVGDYWEPHLPHPTKEILLCIYGYCLACSGTSFGERVGLNPVGPGPELFGAGWVDLCWLGLRLAGDISGTCRYILSHGKCPVI